MNAKSPDPIPPTESRVVRVRALTAIHQRGVFGARHEAGTVFDMDVDAYVDHAARGNVRELGDDDARAAAEAEGAALVAEANVKADALIAAARASAAASVMAAAAIDEHAKSESAKASKAVRS